MYASEEASWWSKAAEIGTWVLLFIVLVPGTALGYFAENSLPNSPLYPVKRDIETVVLTLASVNTSAKSLYELSLATTRIEEAKQLFAANTVTPQDFQQLDAAAIQLEDAQKSIGTVRDSVQKAQMQQQLASSIITYKQQLFAMQQQIEVSNTASSPSGDSSITPPPHQGTPLNPTPTTTDTNAEVTPPPSIATLSDADKQTLEQKIETITQQLDQLTATPPAPASFEPQPTTLPQNMQHAIPPQHPQENSDNHREKENFQGN